MRAVIIESDKSLKIHEVDKPFAKKGEVLIKVRAAALNRADLLQREGNYPPPEGCPPWPGLEVAGIVEAVGEGVEKWSAGDEVCALLGGGGYADFVTVPAEMVMPIPKGLSFVEASAIPEAFATAYLNLFWVAQAKKGETLLFPAATSGLASVVVPMAKAFGLRVITTVRGEKEKASVEYLGADIVVDTLNESLADILKEQEKQGTPVNIAIDCLAGSIPGSCLPFVARGCRYIVIASLAGDKVEVDFRNIYVRNIRIIGSTLRSKTPAEKGEILERLAQDVFPMIEKGKLRPRIYAVMPLEKAEEAQQLLYDGKNVGKVVLEV